jgi:hypothetical protein
MGEFMLTQQPQVTVSMVLSADTIAAIRRQIYGCETCSADASFPLGGLLLRLTGYREVPTDYVLPGEIHCPSCISPLDTETLVELQIGIGRAARSHSTA